MPLERILGVPPEAPRSLKLARRAAAALCLAMLLSVGPGARAESYGGIKPTDTLVDLQARYPNATIERVTPAWLKPDDAFVKVSGRGLPGTLFVFLENQVVFHRNRAAKLRLALETEPPGHRRELMSKLADIDEGLTSQYEDKGADARVRVKWMRWMPSTPLDLSVYRARYGKNANCALDDDDQKPFCEWKSRGVLVNLNAEKTKVLTVEYEFTEEEVDAGKPMKAPAAKFTMPGSTAPEKAPAKAGR